MLLSAKDPDNASVDIPEHIRIDRGWSLKFNISDALGCVYKGGAKQMVKDM